jgi:hypothetical protein
MDNPFLGTRYLQGPLALTLPPDTLSGRPTASTKRLEPLEPLPRGREHGRASSPLTTLGPPHNVGGSVIICRWCHCDGSVPSWFHSMSHSPCPLGAGNWVGSPSSMSCAVSLPDAPGGIPFSRREGVVTSLTGILVSGPQEVLSPASPLGGHVRGDEPGPNYWQPTARASQRGAGAFEHVLRRVPTGGAAFSRREGVVTSLTGTSRATQRQGIRRSMPRLVRTVRRPPGPRSVAGGVSPRGASLRRS